jgi:predicted RNA-binding Zn-ribbon protein involved in translation (DUF1610 family)
MDARLPPKEMIMRCENCRQADLAPSTFLYERITPDGTRLAVEVEGFECPNCADRVILGRDAERISREWYRIVRTRTAVPFLFHNTTAAAHVWTEPLSTAGV